MIKKILIGFCLFLILLTTPVMATTYGSVTDVGTNYITDTGASYIEDDLIGYTLTFTSGDLNGESYDISDNNQYSIWLVFGNECTDASFEESVWIYTRTSPNIAEKSSTEAYSGTYSGYMKRTDSSKGCYIRHQNNQFAGAEYVGFWVYNTKSTAQTLPVYYVSTATYTTVPAGTGWHWVVSEIPSGFRYNGVSAFTIGSAYPDDYTFEVYIDDFYILNQDLESIGVDEGDTYSINYDAPVPVAGFHATPTTGDTPLNVKFWDDSTGGDHWVWYFGDGYYTEYSDTVYGPYAQGGPTHTYYEAGSYTVEQCVQNDYGETWENKTHYIQVGEQPEQDLLAHFYAEPTSGGKPLLVKFWDQSEGDPTHWVWYFGDGTYTEYTNAPYPPYTSGGPTHTYHDSGLYTVKLQVENTTASDWENKTSYITVLAGGPPYADWFASPETGPAPLDVRFYDTSSGDPTDWLWEYDDGYYAEHEPNPWHTFEDPGTYLVTMTCSNEYGEDSKAGYITVTNAKEGTLTVTAIDSTTRALIHTAHIEIEGGGETLEDDNFDGTVSYDLPLGSLYHITVSASGYYDQDFQFVLTEDMTMTVALVRTGTAPVNMSSIDFIVRSNVTAQPLYGAYVHLDEDQTITDQYGTAHFVVPNTSGTLEWLVSKPGYYPEQGWVDTDESSTTHVTLLIQPTPTTATPTTTPTTIPTVPGETSVTATPTEDTRTPEEKVSDAASIWINGAEFISGLLFLAVIFGIVDLFGGRRRRR